MFKFLVAGCVGAAAVAYGLYIYGQKFMEDNEDRQQLEDRNTTIRELLKTDIPDLSDLKVIQYFFHENLKLAEECLNSGQIE